ncbi:glucose-6-phosphate dehydrogenase (NADP(+)) [Nakamurella flava]|uniref:Glucose-6-phosphate 1-dehydrogenase n=1 Tax=Nakamurella flava TaxID=2576308 RepID=A0A4U6QEM6_9ACTN|nr:glucose-6-phosphate dehydrogenase (NADP(+)) [Nakamurella flava]TKV58442.1 glucose-6-phosphate dehydrogenase (NADP(+)) [Nakamurella flava]
MTSSGDPVVFVLFGATGDLAKRMVLPAFFTLAQQKLLPENYLLIGDSRSDRTDDDFRDHVKDVLTEFGPHPDEGPWDDFSSRLRFAGGGFTPDDPGQLVDVVNKAREELGGSDGAANVQLIHYLALPPSAFIETTQALGAHDLAKGTRVVYEKPFGTSPQGFKDLDKAVHQVLDEEQVYRIDHFLGKEATQNLHVVRFANRLIHSVWSAEHVASVQIDAPETLDIDDRAKFYDATGALLDMVVTHLFQVAAEVAMDPPASMAAADLQAAREEVIGCFRPLDPAEVVLGQYDGYTDVEGIEKDSTTDTFVAARLWVDNDRWRGVPFLLRTGKRMAESTQRVSLILKDPSDGPLADATPTMGDVLNFTLKGNGSVDIELIVKKPGAGTELVPTDASIVLADIPDGDPLPPYVRLIHDVLEGDRSLFTRPDGLAHTWEVIEPVLDDRPPVKPYEQGSWGPAEAAALAEPGRWLLGQ